MAGVEREHEIVFRFLQQSLKEGALYKRDKPTLWICGECGYRAVTREAWKVCPLCKAKQGFAEFPLTFRSILRRKEMRNNKEQNAQNEQSKGAQSAQGKASSSQSKASSQKACSSARGRAAQGKAQSCKGTKSCK